MPAEPCRLTLELRQWRRNINVGNVELNVPTQHTPDFGEGGWPIKEVEKRGVELEKVAQVQSPVFLNLVGTGGTQFIYERLKLSNDAEW